MEREIRRRCPTPGSRGSATSFAAAPTRSWRTDSGSACARADGPWRVRGGVPYVRDVDVERVGQTPAAAIRSGTYMTGGTLEVRASLLEQSVAFLDFRYAVSAPDQAAESVEVAPDLKIALPSLRRQALAGFVPVLISRTAFAGSMPTPGKAGWDRAIFLRPQVESNLIHPEAPPDADMRLEFVDVRTLVSAPLGYVDDGWAGEDAESMVSKLKISHPDDWDDPSGKYLHPQDGFLVARNDGPALRRFAATLRDHVVARQSPMRLDFALLALAPEALGVTGGADPLSSAEAAKLLERAQAGEESQVLWRGSGSVTRSSTLVLEDVVQRAIVEGCRAERDGLPDPTIGMADWGVRLRASAGLDPVENAVSFHECRLEFSSIKEPIESAPAVSGAKVRMHLVRRAACRFERTPTARPGAWVAVGVSPLHDRTLVLLARAIPGRIWK